MSMFLVFFFGFGKECSNLLYVCYLIDQLIQYDLNNIQSKKNFERGNQTMRNGKLKNEK